MGCGASRSEPGEIGQAFRIRSLHRRSHCNIEEREDESCSYKSSYDRKSVSSAVYEGVFLRRFVGYTEKERGVEERDVILDSNNNVGLKAVSPSPTMENNTSALGLKQPRLESTEKVVNNRKEERKRPDDVEEDSILFGSGSPSFRVYCVDDDILSTTYEDNGDEERRDTKLAIETGKRSERHRRGRRGRRVRGLRNAMQMGGSTLGLRSVFVARGGSVVGRKSNLADGSLQSQS